MTAHTLPGEHARPAVPSFWQSFPVLFAKEARQNLPTLLVTLVVVVIAQLVIAWRVPVSGAARPGVASVLLLVPLALALLKGIWQVRSEYGQNTHLLLSTLPVKGVTVLLAKYLWLWCEVILLSVVVLSGVLILVGLDIGWEKFLAFQPHDTAPPLNAVLGELGKLTVLAALSLAPLPAVALLATVVGRLARRADLLVGFIVYGALIALVIYLSELVESLEWNWPGVALFESFSGVPSAEAFIPGELLLLPVLLTVAMLWAAGRLFERQDA